MTAPLSPGQQTLPRTPGRLSARTAALSTEAPMSHLTSIRVIDSGAVSMRDLIRRTAVAAAATALVLGASAGAAAASTGTPVSHLYWANQNAGTVVEANLNGTSAHVLASGQNGPHGVA